MNAHLLVLLICCVVVVQCVPLPNDEPLVRTKRIDDSSSTQDMLRLVRTKRIGEAAQKTEVGQELLTRKKRVDPIREKEAEHLQSGQDDKVITPPEPQSAIQETLEDEKDQQLILNDISQSLRSLSQPCHGQLVNQTIEVPGCKPVVIETLICGGVCQMQLTPVWVKDSSEIAFFQDTCSFCGPTGYEVKIVLTQCQFGKPEQQLWRTMIKKVHAIKGCQCLKDLCYRQNKITSELEGQFKR